MIKTSIFDGNFELIHRCFGLAAGKNLKHKSICLGLSPQFVEQQAIAGLVGNLWDQVLSNWSGRIPSQANWRTERQVTIAPQNKSPEVVLERSIAN
ncbi:MAG: hypothetical protein OER56_12205, partial [Hyphomicrobiales bacterium]|nr:hypothetical protein [Hyphomicrobiales bacterium]